METDRGHLASFLSIRAQKGLLGEAPTELQKTGIILANTPFMNISRFFMKSFSCLLAAAILAAFAPNASAYTSATPPTTGPTVPGDRAVVRGGIAYAPANAPEAVKRAIWASNFIIRKPYVWGGGHGSFYENGYDCSGSVSFLLHHAGALSAPAASRDLQVYGQPGRGRWITVYARNGHVFATVAGLRWDTTGAYGDEGPRWRTDGRFDSGFGFAARHPQGM
jgi:hypothetical protein